MYIECKCLSWFQKSNLTLASLTLQMAYNWMTKRKFWIKYTYNNIKFWLLCFEFFNLKKIFFINKNAGEKLFNNISFCLDAEKFSAQLTSNIVLSLNFTPTSSLVCFVCPHGFLKLAAVEQLLETVIKRK